MKKVLASSISRRTFGSTDHSVSGASRIVKYTPCSKQDQQIDDDLEEIAVVSNVADPGDVKYGSGTITANGPRVVPGIITSGCGSGDKTRFIGVEGRFNGSGSRINTSSPVFMGKRPSTDNIKSKSVSRQSLLDLVTSRIGGNDKRRLSRDSIAFINRAHIGSDADLSRTSKGKDSRKYQDIDEWDKILYGHKKSGCKWTFVFDPSGRLCYYWSMVVSVAFLYNFWVLIYRFTFSEISSDSLVHWFTLDYLADLVYIVDIAFHFRTGYLEDGVLQTDAIKLRQHYLNSTTFYIDCLCLLPLDFLYLSIGFNSLLRCFRLIKIYRFWAFLDRTERHTNYPNVFRAMSLTHYILVIFHWNACLYHIVAVYNGFGSNKWSIPIDSSNTSSQYAREQADISWDVPLAVWRVNNETGRPERLDVFYEYLHSFYWSTLTLTTIGNLPRPHTKPEFVFIIFELIFALFLFATVLGHVANIVTNVSAARKEFQAKLDAVKTYMRMRRVPDHLQNKVIKWFDYLWMTHKSSDEERSVGCLPDKLKAEIAIHVHLDTLKRVEIFQNTEAGFLCELVLRLRPVLFSPGDYICRKGEVGKEMYIVNRGRLEVVADNGKTVLATLKAGSYFGEISILNMGPAGNRRTASVRSVGYSDLFCLYKQDMWDVLKEYPAARVRLENIAQKRLEKYKKEPLQRANMLGMFPSSRRLITVALNRSHSTPGLIESTGKIPLEDMQLAESNHAKADSPLSGFSETVNGREEHPYEPVGITTTPHIKLGTTCSVASFVTDSSVGRKSTLPASPSYYKQSPSPNILELGHEFNSVGRRGSQQLTVPSIGIIPSSSIGNIPRDASQEILLAEVKRLRNRLITLEAENASMNMQLSEIELQMCAGSSSGSNGSTDDNERNKESII
ncbi:Uncharacterised protein g1524 [Pycnogonum litorale]